MTTTDHNQIEAAPKDDKSYRGTLNLPQTSFPMKANLVQNEPASIKRWESLGVYRTLRSAGAAKPRWIFHDGPPYANGSIHLGHVLNKSLKDFVVRSKTMAGFDVPYIPGWDCHGLPIEHKVMTDLVASGKAEKLSGLEPDIAAMAVRRACADYASKQVKQQASEMTRLLTMADYAEPYLTMSPAFEERVLHTLADLVAQGLVFRALKPVHWSIENETALAEAELEYEDRDDLSVYVDFETADAGTVYAAFGLDDDARDAKELGQTPSLMIWTTTPWTLPANLAVAVNERFTYALVRVDGNITVMAEALIEKVTKAAKSEDVAVLATAPGSALVGLKYRHPFIDVPPVAPEFAGKCYAVVSAEYVTLEDGTGLVHTAPGHGTEDYQTGQRIGLGVYCPVMGNGSYDDSVPEWLRGLKIWEANELIAKHLRSSGHMFYDHTFSHSYPHDWRSKTPVIFRATEQWFVGVDRPTKRDGVSLRQSAMDWVTEQGDKELGFVPAWGRNRMRGMLESRPDWCISRQRSWGLPIPAFLRPDGTALLTSASTRAVAQVIAQKGSDAWYQLSPAELLASYDAKADPDFDGDSLDVSALTKGRDILDVWFESGSTWNGAMRERSDDQDFPIELYLEGSDQHRGWFQTSLLCALGSQGRPPMKTILTHGFMVGRDGKKLSKSKGDTVEELFKKYGADVIRWWCSSLPYEGDMKVDDEFFRLAGESYRKVRNTIRFLLSNLADFTAGEHCTDMKTIAPTSIDAWVLGEYDRLHADVLAAYARYDFRAVHTRVYDFCNDTLSSVYLAAVKDRLYCDRADAPRRRQTQTVLWDLADGLSRLIAPVLCHTGDEAYRALRPNDADACVHMAEFGAAYGVKPHDAWETVMILREEVHAALELAKSSLDLDNPLDAQIRVQNAGGVLDAFNAVDLADLFGVSEVVPVGVDASAPKAEVIDLRELRPDRCMRSWKRDGTVKQRSDGGMLSDRDAAAIGVA